MNFRSLLIAAAVLTALTPLAAPPASAGGGRLQPNLVSPQLQGRGERAERVLSVREMLQRLPGQLGPGRALDVSPLQYRRERPVYIVNWLRPDGQSREVVVDATSGRVIG